MPPDSSPPDPPLFRLAALIRRELHADDVRVIEPSGAVPSAPNVIDATLPDGRRVAVTFASAPPDATALTRRLEMLVRTFAYSLDELSEQNRAARPPLARSLHDELRGLMTRARAVDAVVLDAHSPVVWGSALHRNPYQNLERTDDLHEQLHRLHLSRLELLESPSAEAGPPGPHIEQDVEAMVDPIDAIDPIEVSGSHPMLEASGSHPMLEASGSHPMVDVVDPRAASGSHPMLHVVDPMVDPIEVSGSHPRLEVAERHTPPPLESMHVLRDVSADDDDDDDEVSDMPLVSQRAMRAVRLLPTVAQLHKGRHLHHMVREDDFGYVAHAFAGIYILVLVFDAPFDELRAERAVIEALPRIERLVLALPPLDPTPEPRANVISLRRARRR